MREPRQQSPGGRRVVRPPRPVATVVAAFVSALLLTTGLGFASPARAAEYTASASPSPAATDTLSAAATAPPSASETLGATPEATATPTATESAAAQGSASASPQAEPASSVSPGTTVMPVTRAEVAAAPLAGDATACDPADLYYLTNYHSATGYPALMKYSSTGSTSTVLNFTSFGAPYPDALGITSTGYGYYIQAIPKQGSAPTITRVDLTTGTKTNYTGTALQTSSINAQVYPAGAVNPVTGIYYYAVPTNLTDYPWDLYAFDTTTNTAIGYVGRITLSPTGGTYGDVAFDPAGNLYLSTNNASAPIVKVAAGSVPTTVKPVGTGIPVTSDGAQSESDAQGLAYVSRETSRQLWSGSYVSSGSTTTLHKRTPGANDSTTGATLSDAYIYDMGSCAASAASVTPKITLKTSVVSRKASTDQFTLAIEQPAGTPKASATTSGTSTGVQASVAGPVDATTSATYTLRETASGTTNLSNYTTSVSCVNDETGASISTSGSDGVYTMTYPPSGVTDVTCTITNTATVASAASCSPADVFYAATQQIWWYSDSTGQATQLGAYGFYPDALAASSTGYVYFVNRDDRDGSTTIYRVDLKTSSQSTYTMSTTLTDQWWSAGAVNPQNGIYYFADAIGRIYAFDTNTNTAIGYVGQTSPAMPADFGDIAFDADGNLYIYWANREIMKVAAADVPLTAQLSTTRLTATATGNATLSYSGPYVSGLAWMSDETDRQLWSTDYTYQNRGIDAQTPGVRSSLQENVLTLPAPSSGYIYDMASCPSAANATPKLSLSKNVIARDNSTDQFTLAIEKPSGTTLVSAKTTGTATGVQSAVAGPIDVTAGSTYTLREVGAGTTDLSRYTSSLVCRDLATNTTVPTSGSDGVYSLAYPAEGISNVSCTIMNSPPAAVTVNKTLPGGRFAASDQFTVRLRTGGTTGTILDTPGTETTSGQGTTVDPGTGTTGKFEVEPGTAYTITESAEAGVDMAQYTSRITCTDPTGLQTGLPTDAAFDPTAGFTLTPVAGAQVSCTLSNTASSGAGVGIGEGLTCRAGYIYAIGTRDVVGATKAHIYEINTATGQQVAYQGELPVGTAYTGNPNSLAISQGGLFSYYSVQLESGSALPIYRQDNVTGQTTLLGEFTVPTSVKEDGHTYIVRGGINPTDGIYWISVEQVVNGQTRQHFWAYNTLTEQNYGYVGYITGTVGGNGDLVFDQDGNMLFVSATTTAGQLWRIEGITSALAGAPRTTSTSIDSFLTKEKLTDLTASAAFNGVTFDNDGYLWVSHADGSAFTSYIVKLDPNTGAQVGNPIQVGGLNSPDSYSDRIVVDLADCNDPGGIRLQKTYPDGRVSSSDNVTLTIVNAATPTTAIVGGTATTSGPAVGLQTDAASVVIGVPAKSYLLREAATSSSVGKLPDYTTSLSCVDKTHANAEVDVTRVAPGEYRMDFPGVGINDGELLANIVCTYTNTPNGRLRLEKQLGTDRDDDADQFQVRILADGQPVTSATTQGTGSTVSHGTTDVMRAQTGVAKYTFDELGFRSDAQSAEVLLKYPNPVLTCADANELQPEADLPNNMSFALFKGITPVPGSEIQCVITNSTSDARIAVVKSGSTQCMLPGATPTPVVYTYTVTNPGKEPLRNVTVSDDKGTPTYVSGDTNGDGILTAGETWVYQMSSTLTQATTNVVTASGTGTESGDTALGQDTWRVGEPSQLTTTKTSSATGKVKAGDTLTYTVAVKNTGTTETTNVAVNDTLPAGVTYVADSAKKTYPTDQVVGTPKQTGTYTYTFRTGVGKYLSAGSSTLSQTLTTANSTIPADAVITGYSMTAVTYKWSSADQANLAATYPGGTALASSAVGGGTQAYFTTTRSTSQVSGTALGTYGLSFTNATTGFWLDSASFTVTYEYGSGQTTTRGTTTDAAHAPSKMVTAADAVTLKPGETMTITYQVKVDDPLASGVTELTNTAAAVWGDKTQCAATGTVTNPVDVPHTLHPVQVEKLGLNCDVGQSTCALGDAVFALYASDPTAAGATPIVGGITADSTGGSTFTTIALAIGEYWLVESKAPGGHELLPAPVHFTVQDGGVQLAADSAPLAMVRAGSAFTIEVLDVTAGPLPDAGGAGPLGHLGLGSLTVLAALVLLKPSGSRRAIRWWA